MNLADDFESFRGGAAPSADDLAGDFESFRSAPPRPATPPRRGVIEAAGDTVGTVVSSALGGAKAVSDFVAPGNVVSQTLGDEIKFIEEGQSEAVKAGREKFQRRAAEAEGWGDAAGAVGEFLVENPVQAAAMALGSLVLPAGAVRLAGGAAKTAGLGAKGVSRAGTAGGGLVGAAMGGGDAAGNAYELVMGIDDEQLRSTPGWQVLEEQGTDPAAIRETLATAAARDASVLPAILGGLAGVVGVERLLAGVGRAGGRGVQALKTAGVEGVTEGVEEGVAQYSGRAAAAELDPSIDPMQGVQAASLLGAALGAGTGGVVGALSPRRPEDLANEIADAPDVDTAIRAATELSGANEQIDEAFDAYAADALATAVNASADQEIETQDGPVARTRPLGGEQQRRSLDRAAELTGAATTAGTEFDRQNLQAQAQTAQAQAVGEPAPGPAAGFVDLTPMNARQAKQRLIVMRDQAAQSGGDALSLVVTAHPSQRGAFAIASRPSQLPSLDLPAPAPPLVDAQQRIESAALAGQDAQRRAEDAPRQDLLRRTMLSIEQRGGVASPYEARVLQEAGLGQPYDRIDESLAPPLTEEQQLTAATGVAVGRAPRSSVTPGAPAQQAAELQAERVEADQARESANERSMAAQEARAAANATARGNMQETVAGMAQPTTETPSLSAVLAAARVPGAQRTAEQQLALRKARAAYSPADMVAIETEPALRTPEQRLAIKRLAKGTKASTRRAPEEGLQVRSQETGETLQLADPATLPQRSEQRDGVQSITREGAGFIERVAKIFGKRVVFYDGSQVEDGFIVDDDPDTVYLNIRSTKPHLVVLGHEVTHALRKDSPEVYAALEAAIKKQLSKDAESKFTEDYGSGANLEELTSDLVGNRFREQAFWEGVFNDLAADLGEQQATGVVARLGAAVIRAVNAYKKVLLRDTSFKTDELVADLDAVKSAVQAAIRQYAKDRRIPAARMAAETMRASATREGAIRSTPREQPRDEEGRFAAFDDELSAVAAQLERTDQTRSSTRRDEDLGEFRKNLGDRIATNLEYGQMLARRHAWAFEIGDTLLSTKTGKVYTLTGRTFQRVGRIKDNNWQPVYSYEQGDAPKQGEKRPDDDAREYQVGIFPEKSVLESKTLVPLTRPFTKTSTRRTDDGVPEYGEPAPGAISVRGVHYSREPRSTLASSFAGTGLKGADNERIAREGGIKERVYFYVEKARGVIPETGVGGYAHEVQLNNLYDADADPAFLAEDSPSPSAFEQAVLDAGFDGYYRDSFRNDVGAAVLLGGHQVPVKQTGRGPSKPSGRTPSRAKAPTRTGWRKVVADLRAARSLPGGQLEPQRWSTVLRAAQPESQAALDAAGVFTGDEPLYKDELIRRFSNAQRAGARASTRRAGDTRYQEQATELLSGIQPPARSAVALMRGEQKAPVFNNIFELSQWFTRKNRRGAEDMNDPAVKRRMLDALYADTLMALTDAGSAVGWYDAKVKGAMDLVGQLHPEINTSEEARFGFISLLAISSNQTKVDENFEIADALYNAWRRDGAFPTDVGAIRDTRAKTEMSKSLVKMRELITRHGFEKVRSFMTSKLPVREIEAFTGYPVTGEGKDSKVYGATFLGPKIGAFFNNLYGNYDTVTMDRWFMRTVNRIRGSMLDLPANFGDMLSTLEQQLDAGTDTFGVNEQAIRDDIAAYRALPAAARGDILATLSVMESVRQYAKARHAKFARGREVGGKMRSYVDRTPENQLAKNLDLALHGDSQTPRGGADRELMRELVFKLQKRLKDNGIDMVVADVQAALWYYEKDLKDLLRGQRRQADLFGEAVKEAEDYETAARKLLAARRGDSPGGTPGFAGRARPAVSERARSRREQPADTQDLFAETRASNRRGDAGRARGGLAPLPGSPVVDGATGPDPRIVEVAEAYAEEAGIDYERQPEYVEVDEARAKRIADAYDAMAHAPSDPAVRRAYSDLIRQTKAQYDALVSAGYEFWFMDPESDPYQGNPWNAMRDLRANQSMAVFPTEAGFGSGATDLDTKSNPLLADTGVRWSYGSPGGPKKRVLANDLFRAVHDAFGHGLEGAGFRARGEENAWQAHAKLFTGSALGALTSETRGQNSWLNYGPFGARNRDASVEETVFADQKTGLMPEWTWQEGLSKPATIVASTQQSTRRPDGPVTVDFDGRELIVQDPRAAVSRLDAKIDKYQELIKCLRS